MEQRTIAAILLQEILYEDHSLIFIVLCLFETNSLFFFRYFFSWKYEKQNDTSILRLMATYFQTRISEF